MPRSVRKRNSEESYKAVLRNELNKIFKKKKELTKSPLGMEYTRRRSSKASPVSAKKTKRRRPKRRKSVRQRGGIVRAGSHQRFPKCK